MGIDRAAIKTVDESASASKYFLAIDGLGSTLRVTTAVTSIW
jgi:hypothetical protein